MMSFKSLCAGIALCGASAIAFAATNPLSVHVLNLQDGLPSPGVKVLLEKQDGKNWTGNYRVTFKTGEWFTAHKQATFFPEVPVIFAVDGTVPHYHIPLLLSPYGFSTYRGN